MKTKRFSLTPDLGTVMTVLFYLTLIFVFMLLLVRANPISSGEKRGNSSSHVTGGSSSQASILNDPLSTEADSPT